MFRGCRVSGLTLVFRVLGLSGFRAISLGFRFLGVSGFRV